MDEAGRAPGLKFLKLPAGLAPTRSAAAVRPAAAIAATAAALGLRTRFIDVERAALNFAAVQAGNGAVRLGGVGHFDERKTARPAGITVSDKIDTFNVAISGKQPTDG